MITALPQSIVPFPTIAGRAIRKKVELPIDSTRQGRLTSTFEHVRQPHVVTANKHVNEMYFAHSTDDPSQKDWQTLADHLLRVAALAEQRGKRFGAGEMTRTLGLLHDLGKYTPDFQKRLLGAPLSVDHSTAGAIVAGERFGKIGQLLAYAIAGHHAGLANGQESGTRTPLQTRLSAGVPALDDKWQREIVMPERLAPPALALRQERRIFQFAFFTRMIFSCLVDADYIETEDFYAQLDGRAAERGNRPDLVTLRAALDDFFAELKTDGPVDHLRRKVLAHVRRQAEERPGHFTLTVPTGGGKTLTSLAFALDHAIAHGMDRVIYVIPFTSIVEQNAAVFRQALGRYGDDAVLEHHSAFDATTDLAGRKDTKTIDKLRRDCQNWDAPIVVTTAVQFFESLFAAKTSRCRKLHNIVGSVVILDEAQTLPLPLLRPSVAALDELALNYRSSIVFCTATQPAIAKNPDDGKSGFVDGLRDVRELAPDPPQLFRSLDRVTVRHAGTLTDEALTTQLLETDQILCIVNNRRHARTLFESIYDKPGAFHLTTAMCAVHRRTVLADIRERLFQRHPCRVVATSLIEAGVDVDFPRVLRAEAGLDAIAQAAGRCNREGRRAAADSEVRVFATKNPDWAPPPELKQCARTMGEVLRNHPNDEPLSPAVIEAYFRTLYWQTGEHGLDQHAIMSELAAKNVENLPFELLEDKFRLIENTQLPIIIPYDKTAKDAIHALSHAEYVGSLARRLQPYTVQVPRKSFDALLQVGAICAIEPERLDYQFVQLVNPDLYNRESGLSWTNPTFMSAERLIV